MRPIRFVRTSLLALLLLTTVWAPPASAAITRTNLVNAVDDQVITLDVGSATSLAVGHLLWIDDEAMRVVRIVGTSVTVQRGTDGTIAASHAASAIIHFGPGRDFETWVDIDRGGTVESATIRATGKLRETVTVTTTSAGSQTLTTTQVLGGLILHPAAAAETLTLPTAALFIAALPRAKVGDFFTFTIRNTAGGAFTITVAGGTGGTISGTATIAQSNSKAFGCRLDSATAYTCYSLGTVVH